MRYKYICFEGIDGSGKSTLCNIFCDFLEATPGVKPIVIHDPDSKFPGDVVREAWNQSTPLADSAWALLFAASSISAQVRPSGIINLLKTNFTVLADRCALSTYAYLRNNCSFEWLDSIHMHYFFPEIIFFLDINPSLALERLTKDNRQKDYSIEYFENIRSRYCAGISHLKSRGVNVVTLQINSQTTTGDLVKSISGMAI